MGYHRFYVFLMVLLLVSPRCQSCRMNAYRQLSAGCREILASNEKRLRFAWHYSDCIVKDNRMPPFLFCDKNWNMFYCLSMLNNEERQLYLDFLLNDSTDYCYLIQNQELKRDTKRLVNEDRQTVRNSSQLYVEDRRVNELKNSAQSKVEDKLDCIEDRIHVLLQNSNQIHDSLHALDTLIHIVDQITHSLEGSMNSLIEHSEIVCKIAGGSGIAISQRELRYGHVTMNVNLMEGIAILDSAYKNLGCEVDTLRNKAIEIEKEMSKFEQSEALEDETFESKQASMFDALDKLFAVHKA